MRSPTNFIRARHLRIFSRSKSASADLRGLKLAYVGDGEQYVPLADSRRSADGAHIRMATPAGYEADAALVAEAKRVARETRGKIEVLRSPEEAVAGVQAVYTDVWASMGQEDEWRSGPRTSKGMK